MITVNSNFKGLSFVPKFEKMAIVSKHKYGAVATWSHCTDTVQVGYEAGEINAFKHNLEVTIFDNFRHSPVSEDERLDIYKSGRVGFGVYFPTEYWSKPGIPYSTIPDHFSDTWTSWAFDEGLIPENLIGTPKPTRYPDMGQEIYDLTGGKYGYDYINGTVGQVDATSDLIQYTVDWFNNLYGFYPSAASYRNGKTGIRHFMPNYYLGVRDSEISGDHLYDIDKVSAASIPLTTRQGDSGNVGGNTNANFASLLTQAIENGGWFRDFTHWHNSTGGPKLNDFFETQKAAMGEHDVVSLDFGTALEYMFLRKMATRSGIYTSGNELVLMTQTKNVEDVNPNPINTSLSVEVDLTGTLLEGKEIEGVGDKGIIKKSANHFIIEVPYSKKDGFHVVKLRESFSPNYLDLSLPVILSVNKNGNVLSVVTDKPTKVVVFAADKGAIFYQSKTLKRDSTLNTSHSFDLSGVDFTIKDIYIGAVTKERQSVLSDKYNF